MNAKIVDITQEGDGVAKVNGYALFIQGVLPNEEVKCQIFEMKKNYGKAKVVEILKKSPYRIKPLCSSFGVCGGCDLLHMNYDAQILWKKQMVEETLHRIGQLNHVRVNEVIAMENPYFYRNKIQVPFSFLNQKVECGYYQKKTHQIIPLNQCLLQSDEMTNIVRFIRNLCNELSISAYNEKSKTGFLKHVLIRENHHKEIMIVLVTKEKNFPSKEQFINKLLKRYPQIVSMIQNINSTISNVILGPESFVLYGEDHLDEQLCEFTFTISHQSFFQVNRIQTEKLYQKVLELVSLSKEDEVIDGFCGIGTMSLLLAKRAKHVYGIEIVPMAVQNAIQNAKRNHIQNVTFKVGKVEDEIGNYIHSNIHSIVLDPPRKGLEKNVIDTIIQYKIPKVVYVSCNIATLARDLSLFKQHYQVNYVCIVDMFCHTCGIETVVLLSYRTKLQS